MSQHRMFCDCDLHISEIPSRDGDEMPVEPLVHQGVFHICPYELKLIAIHYTQQLCYFADWAALTNQGILRDLRHANYIYERFATIRKFLDKEELLAITSRVTRKWEPHIASSKRLRQKYGPMEGWESSTPDSTEGEQ